MDAARVHEVDSPRHGDAAGHWPGRGISAHGTRHTAQDGRRRTRRAGSASGRLAVGAAAAGGHRQSCCCCGSSPVAPHAVDSRARGYRVAGKGRDAREAAGRPLVHVHVHLFDGGLRAAGSGRQHTQHTQHTAHTHTHTHKEHEALEREGQGPGQAAIPAGRAKQAPRDFDCNHAATRWPIACERMHQHANTNTHTHTRTRTHTRTHTLVYARTHNARARRDMGLDSYRHRNLDGAAPVAAVPHLGGVFFRRQTRVPQHPVFERRAGNQHPWKRQAPLRFVRSPRTRRHGATDTQTHTPTSSTHQRTNAATQANPRRDEQKRVRVANEATARADQSVHGAARRGRCLSHGRAKATCPGWPRRNRPLPFVGLWRPCPVRPGLWVARQSHPSGAEHHTRGAHTNIRPEELSQHTGHGTQIEGLVRHRPPGSRAGCSRSRQWRWWWWWWWLLLLLLSRAVVERMEEARPVARLLDDRAPHRDVSTAASTAVSILARAVAVVPVEPGWLRTGGERG